ncbi:MAG: glycosyltransferase family 4 protein [Hyphomicrobiaceae bacterium]
MSHRGPGSHLKIACVIPTMRAGGAERVVAELCSYLVKRRDEVHLLTLTTKDEEPFYKLHPAIQQIRIGQLPAEARLTRACRIAQRTLKLRSAIKEIAPDLVLSNLTVMNILVLMATRGLGVPVIASEHNDIDAEREDLGRLRDFVRHLTYPTATRITVLTQRSFGAIGEALAGRTAIIPNPIRPAVYKAQPGQPAKNGRYRIISVGRLVPQKAQHVGIEAFASLASSFPEWDFVIFGEGPQRTELQALIHARGLSDRVFLPGLTQDVEKELSSSHVFALPSLYEGFPMSLGEGLAVGLPATAFAKVSGVEELILHERTGLIASGPDPTESLAEQLSRLMRDARLRATLGAAARKHVRAWRPELVFGQWSELFDSVGALAETGGVRPPASRVIPHAADLRITAHAVSGIELDSSVAR